MTRFCVCVAVALAVIALPAVAQDVEPVPQEMAQRLGEMLTKAAEKIEKPQVKIEADPSKSVAVAVQEVEGGVLLVPQKGLDEENTPDMTVKNGVPLGLLFSSSPLVPVIDGKLVDRKKMRVLKVEGRQGETEVNCLLLSVRQISDEDYRLYGFGKGPKPVIDVKFDGGEGPGDTPVALEIEPGEPATVVVTVFDKYQAKFQGGTVE